MRTSTRPTAVLLSAITLIASSAVDTAFRVGQGSAGCGKIHEAVGETRSESINSTCCGDVTATRNYNIHLPSNYDPDTPTALIVSYHGAGETMKEHEEESQLSKEPYNHSMIVVYPQGVGVSTFSVSLSMDRRFLRCDQTRLTAQMLDRIVN